jgi:hypothetical protein
MLVLRSTHKAVIAGYEARIADLYAQISDLKRLIFVPEQTHAAQLPSRVANAVLDGDEVQPQKDETLEAAQREAARIFSGEYEWAEGE